MDREQVTIERIKFASQMSLSHYGLPIVCTYSGGKDSDITLEMFLRAGVPFEVHNSHTTVDAPETVYHIRKKFAKLEERGIKCEIEKPPYIPGDEKNRRYTMWSLIVKKKLPPTRIARYCCSVLKEGSCRNRMIATGVRWDESTQRASRGRYEVVGKTKKDRLNLTDEEMMETQSSRDYEQLRIPGTETEEIMLMNDNSKKRRFIEKCNMKAKTVCNPIIEWTDREVWDFIRSEGIEINPLYEMGFTRVGCIGCPCASHAWREKEFEIYPKYKAAYIRAFDNMLEAMRNDGSGKVPQWKNGEEVFAWWMEYDDIPGQMKIEDIEGAYQDY